MDTEIWVYRRLNILSHIGFISIPFFVIGLFSVFFEKLNKRNKQLGKYILIFLPPGIIAFLWQSSDKFNEMIYKIPVLNRFRWPFKLQFFTSFYMIIIAAIGFASLLYIVECIAGKVFKSNIMKNSERFKADNANKVNKLIKINKRINLNKLKEINSLLSQNGKAVSITAILVITVQISNFVWLYCFNPQVNFGQHLDSVPLVEPLKDILDDGKVVSVGFNIWEPNYINVTGFKYNTLKTMGFNYPTLWGLYGFAGYDPLVSYDIDEACLYMNFEAVFNNYSGKLPLDYFRKWGVKWYIVDNNELNNYAVFKNYNEYSLEIKYKDEFRTVFLDKRARSVVHWSDTGSNNNIKYKINTNSIEIDVDSEYRRKLGINFIYNEYFNVKIDGQKYQLDIGDYGQITVEVPEGRHHIVVTYREPKLIKGCIISLAFAAIIAAGIITVPKFRRKISRLQKNF